MAACGKNFLGGLKSQIAAGDSFFGEMALPNAGAIKNPLVGGVDHFFQVGVGKQAGRNVGSQSADLGAQKLTHSQDVSSWNVNPLLCSTRPSRVQ